MQTVTGLTLAHRKPKLTVCLAIPIYYTSFYSTDILAQIMISVIKVRAA